MQESGTPEQLVSITIAVYPERGEPDITVVRTLSEHATEEAFHTAMNKVAALEGSVPGEALRELIDNLIHAEFKGAVISILDEGNTVRVSDKGPGIEDKDRAFEFGYSGATPEVLEKIRGAGGGLGIARLAAKRAGGMIILDDNLGGGTVATVSTTGQLPEYERSARRVAQLFASYEAARKEDPERRTALLRTAVYKDDEGNRQVIPVRNLHVLLAVFEGKLVGPTAVADRLGMSVSMAYRDLAVLVERGLVNAQSESGQYAITDLGTHVIREHLSAMDTNDLAPQGEERMAEDILDRLKAKTVEWKERIEFSHNDTPSYRTPLGVFPSSRSLRHIKDEDARESQE